MKRPRKKNLGKTSELPYPNPYALMLMNDYAQKAFDDDKAENFKGSWREKVLRVGEDFPLDIEIGTGNGYHFAHRASHNLQRGLVGFEVKYKPLIQTIRRALKAGAKNNAYVLRYDASQIKSVFDEGEVNNVFIHHPDPWSKKSQWKHRLIQEGFLEDLYTLMRPQSFIEFKTDNEDYFNWALKAFENSKFKVDFKTRDLHHSEKAQENFITHFESIFIKKGQPIYYLLASN